MKPDIREHFQSADEFLRESEHLVLGGFYRGAMFGVLRFHSGSPIRLRWIFDLTAS